VDDLIATRENAEIDKARAHVEELTRLLEAKQKELMEVQKKLSQVTARIARMRERPQFIDVDVPRGGESPVVVVPEPAGKPPEGKQWVYTRRIEDNKSGEVDQKRLEKIEKTLQQLLDEAARLKKARAK
jgi:predicted  nucleic acid-binding Zn-ribbon protein